MTTPVPTVIYVCGCGNPNCTEEALQERCRYHDHQARERANASTRTAIKQGKHDEHDSLATAR